MDFSVVLDNLGYSKCRRDLGRTTQLLGQYLEDKCIGRKAITSGGMAECSNIAGSDSDVMEVINLYKVLEKNKSNAHSTGTTQLQKRIPVYISRKCCNEGYCRLECSTLYINAILAFIYEWSSTGEIKPHEIISYIIYKRFLSITQNYNDRYYISSKLFRDKVIPRGFDPPGDQNESQLISNGPAMTYDGIDTVMCLQLDQWPTEAKTWSSRERHNNWPNKELISHLEKNVSCYVVPIGSKSSTESDLEWRISFVEIERNLIWNMNDAQFKCFVLLKVLKREYMKSTISTYHIKNVAFWLCEELSETYWEKHSLVTCVKRGLQKLRQYVKDGYLPHYIVPNNNLFLNKTIRKPDKKKHALQLLDKICHELEDKLLQAFLDMYGEQDMSRALSPDISSICQSLIIVREYCKRCSNAFMFVRLRNGQSLCANIFKRFGQDCKDILPCLRLALSKFKLREDNRTYNQIDDFIVKMKKEENKIDYLTVALTCAMVYFVHSRYFDVRNALVQKLEGGSNKCYMAHTGERFWMCVESGDITHCAQITSKEVEDIRTHRNNLVMDFVLVPQELEYVPFPLKLQLSLCGGRTAMFCNPLVLSCYMLYISEYNLDLVVEMQKTRAVFENVVSKVQSHPFHYVHLNLLGHSLYVTGDRKSAFKYFVMSSMAFPSSNNGAVYHIACMINDIVQKKYFVPDGK